MCEIHGDDSLCARTRESVCVCVCVMAECLTTRKGCVEDKRDPHSVCVKRYVDQRIKAKLGTLGCMSACGVGFVRDQRASPLSSWKGRERPQEQTLMPSQRSPWPKS